MERADFACLDWQSPRKGLRYKLLPRGRRQLRLVEYTPELEPQWCEHEHQGYVLEGRLEIAFPYGLRVYEPGDGIFVRPGREHRHKHRALTDVVRVIYVEYI